MGVFSYHKPLVLVDIETTGASPMYSKILEIAIIRIEGGVIVETLNTVIDPGISVPDTILSLTGIKEDEIKRAPSFNDISKDVKDLLEGAVFVAHNARFDYSFIKSEFAHLGINFSSKRLCTVALSRSLFPAFKRHDLSSIIERFDFKCEHRHRAYDDAAVLHDFLKIAEKKLGREIVEEKIAAAIGKARVPHNLQPDLISSLPECPGVYVFYGENSEKLYIGKSINIKKRVMSHFSSSETGKALRIAEEVRDIEVIPTTGELGALLLESHLIKKEQPLYNRMSRRMKKLSVIKEDINEDGYKRAIVETYFTEEMTGGENVLGIFRSLAQAKKVLQAYAESHKLCPRLLGLEKGSGQCFYSQIGKCTGACAKKETAELYNSRFTEAFNERKIKIWPYAGPVVINEKNRESKHKGTAFIVDQWKLVGSFTYDEDARDDFLPASFIFDYDAYKILSSRLLKPRKDIKVISHDEASRLLTNSI